MRIVMFYHSLVSDWNHGNAHFLRGVVSELLDRGHQVTVYEPRDGWSRRNLLEQHGRTAIRDFQRSYPNLSSILYREDDLDLDGVLDGADLALVHEWNEPSLINCLGCHRQRMGQYRLLFHDTHHRALTCPQHWEQLELDAYDGVLAFGRILRDYYLERRIARHAWTWHEAADVRVFHPRPATCQADLVWIGNWGDDERTAQLRDFLIEPVRRLGLRARVYGVRYPRAGRMALRRAGIEYAGWLGNMHVPEVFARYRVTVHVPRQAYTTWMRGIPTIRPFEALACGIPLVSAPWDDAEGLFRPGADYLVARNCPEMIDQLHRVLNDADLAASLAAHGLETILQRHTCAHRVDELMHICAQLGLDAAGAAELGSARLVQGG